MIADDIGKAVIPCFSPYKSQSIHKPILKPFWRYYGGKYRAAPYYPSPLYDTIVEPFAGAAGYSLRYYRNEIILLERYRVIYDIWDFLIESCYDDLMSIPEVENIDSLPSDTPPGARALVGFSFNDATTRPSKTLSKGRKKLREMGRNFEGWCEARKQRIAAQLDYIKHWSVFYGSYDQLPNIGATWFIDPPYQKQGKHYLHNQIDYQHLGEWCKSRKGQVIVCEQEGADWLPFRSFRQFKGGISNNGYTLGSMEVIWTND